MISSTLHVSRYEGLITRVFPGGQYSQVDYKTDSEEKSKPCNDVGQYLEKRDADGT